VFGEQQHDTLEGRQGRVASLPKQTAQARGALGRAHQCGRQSVVGRVCNDTQEAWQMLQFSWLAHREGWPLLDASRVCG
jgi:hypothetical protein